MNQASAHTFKAPGNTISTVSVPASDSLSPSPADSAKELEILIEYVRANRENIRRTWGDTSPQYHAANEIMQKYFNESVQKLNIDVQGASLEELIAKMSIQ